MKSLVMIDRSRRTTVYLLPLISLVALPTLIGCARTVTFKYSHLANCHVFQSSPNSTTDAGEGLYRLYRINSIQNHGSSKAKFFFKEEHLYAPAAGNGPYSSTSINAHIVAELASDKTVDIGATVNDVGKVFIRVPLSGDLNAQKFSFTPLGYSGGSSVTTNFIQEAPSNPGWHEPCTTSGVYSYP